MCSIRRMSFPFVGSWWCWMSQGELFALRIFSLIDCCHLENFGTAGHETCPVCHLHTACTNCMDVSQQLPCYCSSGASSSPALTSLIINQQPCHPLVFHFPQLTPPAPSVSVRVPHLLPERLTLAAPPWQACVAVPASTHSPQSPLMINTL